VGPNSTQVPCKSNKMNVSNYTATSRWQPSLHPCWHSFSPRLSGTRCNCQNTWQLLTCSEKMWRFCNALFRIKIYTSVRLLVAIVQCLFYQSTGVQSCI